MKSFKTLLNVCLLPALLLCLAPIVVADDEEEVVRELVVHDLQWDRSAPVVEGPDLYVPTDGDETIYWMFEGGGERPVKFGEDRAGYRVPLKDVSGVLQTILDTTTEGDLDKEIVDADKLFLRGSREDIRAAISAFEWLQRGLAPSIRVTATLTRVGSGGALLATGSTVLQPGAWTGVYRQGREVPLAVDWEIEIAQESTAVAPQVMDMPEGEELYLRYHPGETISVIELWSGALRHLDVFRVDLSGIRNVPEASGFGSLELPQTAAYRAYTVFTVPVGEASRRVFSWNGPAGPVSLALDLSAPPAVPAPFVHGETMFATFRTGALDGALDFDRRDDVSVDYVGRATNEYMGSEYHSRLTDGFVWYEGDHGGVPVIAKVLREAEARLETHHVQLRVLTVAEESLRQALEIDTLGCGRVVTTDALASLGEDGGSANGESVSLHVLDGLDASFRSGKSVMGIAGSEVEVAQQSGGCAPVVDALFDGLAGELSATRVDEGFVLDIHARVDHASAEEGRLELVHRVPIGMKTERDSYPTRDATKERTTLPLLGGGSAVVACSVLVPERGQEILADVVVRGGEAYLVLVSVMP